LIHYYTCYMMLRFIMKKKIMSEEDKVLNLFDEAEIKQKVFKVWETVFAASSKVISHANNFGFLGMEIIPSPNIHEMLAALQIFSSIIDILIVSAEDLEVSYDEVRLMLNAKEQLTRMERLATALKANNRSDFNLALQDLERQAVI